MFEKYKHLNARNGGLKHHKY